MMTSNIQIDLLSFVKTGNFGNLEFGMTKQELIDIGLEPDDWMNHYSKDTSPIWCFGKMELYFDLNGKFHQVFTDYLDKIEDGKTMSFKNHWILNDNSTLKDTINALELLDLGYKENVKLYNSIELQLENKVTLSFHPDQEDDHQSDWKMGAIWKDVHKEPNIDNQRT